MSDVVRKIQEIFANAGNMDISTLLSRIDDELAKFAKKSYQADAEFVAATVASAAEGESNDRDVNALIHLYDALLKSRKSA
jgi:hypothetical protein